MPKKKTAILLWALLALSLAGSPGAGQDRESFSALDRLVGQVENLFPFTEGYVVSVREGELILDLKRGQPVKPGDRLKLIRFGKELIHPVTGKKLGRMETDLGEVEILEVRKDFSRAMTADPSIDVHAGDGVRSPFKKLSLLLAPVEVGAAKTPGSDRLQLDLEKKFNRRPRFEVPSFDLGLWMLESGLRPRDLLNPKNLQRLRGRVKVDYLLFAALRPLKGKTVLKYRLVSARDGSVVKQAQILSGQSPARTAVAGKNRSQTVQSDFSAGNDKVNFVGKQTFPFEIVDFDVGDINGDGSDEFAIIDSHRVLIYKYLDGKFKFIAQARVNRGEHRFISVDVADINGNGKAEIFVTSKYLDGLGSFVIEAGHRGFKKLWDKVDRYFHVIHPFNAKPRLLSQRAEYDGPFRRGIKTVLYRNKKYVEGPELKTPPVSGMKFILYGLTQTDINFDKDVETIILDNDYHLRVYSADGVLLVKSDEYYGHDPRLIDVGVKDFDLTPQGKPVHYRGRLLLERNGNRRFILVPRNYRLGGALLAGMVVVNNSSLVILGINEEGFAKVYETKRQKGYIAAYQIVDDPKAGSRKIHVAVVQPGGLLGKGASTIFTYDWAP
ncbi:MAG: FG-GAP repeat domain-containing protein [Nitrospinales bacterium]